MVEEPAGGSAVDEAWLDDVGVGVVVEAPDGTVMRANRAAQRLAGALAGHPVPTWPAGVQAVRHDAGDGRAVTLLAADAGAAGRFERDTDLVRTIIDATPVGVCVTDENGMLEQVNAAYEGFYGYSADELIGRHFTIVVPEEERQRLADLHDEFIAEGFELRGEWLVVGRDGQQRTILADACRIVGADGRFRKVTFVVDITDRTRIEAELARANARLAHLATHDTLTGLPNRRRTLEVLHDAVDLVQRYEGGLAVATIDVDHFKRVNDTWGHAVGDDVLAGFGEALGARLRATDTAGRVGGEEFLIVMPGTGPGEAVALVAALQELCRDRVVLPDGSGIAFSAGVAAHAPGDSAGDLLRRADRALYAAKEAGRDRVELG